MVLTTSYIFQDDESNNLHVKVDWWNPNSRKYITKILERYWVPYLDETKLGSIPFDMIVRAWRETKENTRRSR